MAILTSIIISCHNEGELLAKTLESCIETSAGLDYEIIVADDASTDGSAEAAARRFAPVRLHRQPKRQGASPTKHLGAQQARGEVLLFLDGHSKPELGALAQLARDVEETEGRAIITPRILALDERRWQNVPTQVGHGYAFDLHTMDSRWVSLEHLQKSQLGRAPLYESPALIGCALAVSRSVYSQVWGFDANMKFWGVEDLDFSLKCWLLGHPILHDPKVSVGHRFQESFSRYSVPPEHIVVNQMRLAYKNYTHAVWSAWLAAGQQRHTETLPENPEGLWARAWELFKAGEDSARQERSYLHARRERDEFWYARRFGLSWPQLTQRGRMMALPLTAAASPSPGPSASPKPLLSRRSMAALSQAEIAQLIDAILKLKSEIPSGSTISSYAKYVKMHNDAMMRMSMWSHDNDPGFPPLPSGMSQRNAAHSGPSFFPWHRQMILLYERDLQRVSGNPNLALPYWDWAADQDSGTLPATWKVFQVFSLGGKTNIGFGGDGDASGNVQTGSFRAGAWRIVDDQGVLVSGSAGNLQREFGRDSAATTLPTGKDVSDALNLSVYDTAPWDSRSSSSCRNSSEGWAGPTGVVPDPKGEPELHNRVHVWVGGSMNPGTSPNDPIFFLHHCNVDRLFSQWLASHPGAYLPVSGGPPGHNLNDRMWPWDGAASPLTVTPASLLDTTKLGYQYV